jgi:hypothetical protein
VTVTGKANVVGILARAPHTRLNSRSSTSRVQSHHSPQEARWTALARSEYLIRDLTNPCQPTTLPMPKSRGRKPKKKRAPASAPKKRLDNLNATPQVSTQQPSPLATAPRQEQRTQKIKQIAKLTTAVVLAAIAILLCAYAFMLTKQ